MSKQKRDPLDVVHALVVKLDEFRKSPAYTEMYPKYPDGEHLDYYGPTFEDELDAVIKLIDTRKLSETTLSKPTKQMVGDKAMYSLTEWFPTLVAIFTGKRNWWWIKNTDCKHLQLQIDMRDGSACLSVTTGYDQDKVIISPEYLSSQYDESVGCKEPFTVTSDELGIELPGPHTASTE